MAPTRRKSRAREATPPSSSSSEQEPIGDLHDFNARVYSMVRRVPEGMVSSYGDIARYLSRPQNSRLVGAAMKQLPASLSSPHLPQQPVPSSSSPTPSTNSTTDGRNDEDEVLPPPEANPDFVPWHRIVSSSGVISPRGNERSLRRQADYLRAEGVEVDQGPRAGGGGGGNDGGRGGGGGGPGTVDAFGLGGAGRDGGRVRMAEYRWKGPGDP